MAKKGSIELIADERVRQMRDEGFTAKNDDVYEHDELALAAVCYAMPDGYKDLNYDCIPNVWPQTWSGHWWKPTNRIRDLVKAGALIAAEIDRLQRIADGD
jgi:hypothetical protein